MSQFKNPVKTNNRNRNGMSPIKFSFSPALENEQGNTMNCLFESIFRNFEHKNLPYKWEDKFLNRMISFKPNHNEKQTNRTTLKEYLLNEKEKFDDDVIAIIRQLFPESIGRIKFLIVHLEKFDHDKHIGEFVNVRLHEEGQGTTIGIAHITGHFMELENSEFLIAEYEKKLEQERKDRAFARKVQQEEEKQMEEQQKSRGTMKLRIRGNENNFQPFQHFQPSQPPKFVKEDYLSKAPNADPKVVQAIKQLQEKESVKLAQQLERADILEQQNIFVPRDADPNDLRAIQQLQEQESLKLAWKLQQEEQRKQRKQGEQGGQERKKGQGRGPIIIGYSW